MSHPVNWFHISAKDYQAQSAFYGKAFAWKLTPAKEMSFVTPEPGGIPGGIAATMDGKAGIAIARMDGNWVIHERGDDNVDVLLGPLVHGHTLVVVWEHAGAPLRNVLVSLGTSTTGASGQFVLPKQVANNCPLNNVRADPAILSASIGWECSGQEENSVFTINGASVSTTFGGSDDAKTFPFVNRCGIHHGGLQTGGIIGASDKRGEDVAEHANSPHDFLATIYHHLGIDSAKETINDFSGRPTPIVPNGSPIRELIRV